MEEKGLTEFGRLDLKGRMKTMKAMYIMNPDSIVTSNGLKNGCDLVWNNVVAVECKDINAESTKYPRVIIDEYKIRELRSLNCKFYLAYSYADNIVRFYDFEKIDFKGDAQYNPNVVTYKTTVNKDEWVSKARYFWDADKYDFQVNIREEIVRYADY